MWKTRFEVSTPRTNDFIRQHTRSSSSTIIPPYCSRPSPTVPRVREDSLSAIVRPSPPSSAPNLAILTEEDEDIPCSKSTNTESCNFISRRRNSSQTINRYQLVLPTILESNDHELTVDHVLNEDSINDRHDQYMMKLKPQESFVATNTNYNQVKNIDLDRKERILNRETTELTIDRRINELLQHKTDKQKKSISSSTDMNNTELLKPTTFKDISAFFEKKSLTTNTLEQKKMIRARRSLPLKNLTHVSKHHVPKLETITSSEKEDSSVFHHQIKRIKNTHPSDFHSLAESEFRKTDIIEDISQMTDNDRSKQEPIRMKDASLKKSWSKQWYILMLFITIIVLYFYVSNIYKNTVRFNSFVYLEKFPQQSKVSIDFFHDNIFSRYGHFVRNRFFSLFDLLLTFLAQILSSS